MSHCSRDRRRRVYGSHLSEQLIAAGHSVVGVDAFIPYSRGRSRSATWLACARQPAFAFHELDLRDADLAPVVSGVDIVFHTAAMAGLLRSWQQFDDYMTCNILATQRLLGRGRKGGGQPLPALLDLLGLRPLCDGG